MDHHPPSDEKPDDTRYLENTKDSFTFDVVSGIYKPKAYEAGKKGSEKTKRTNPWCKAWTDKKFIITSVLSIFTFFAVAIYAYYAALQWSEMRKATRATQDAAGAAVCAATTSQDSLQFARDSFHISERPYVTVSSVAFDAPLEPDKEIGLSIIADNSGHTPALKVAFSGAAYIDRKMIEGKFMNLKAESVIPSQHPTKAHYTLSFSSTDLDRVISSATFKIDGTIRYTDIFNEWHPTTYCAIYDSKQKVFKFCPSGNDVK
jgi:hypothetical protein